MQETCKERRKNEGRAMLREESEKNEREEKK